MPPDETIIPGSPGGEPPGSGADIGPGALVGPYKLIRFIDAGGMGEVWLAERRDTFRQKVALKLLAPSSRVSPREAIARFEQEREVLASLSHEHVAKIHDGGIHGGRPWFAMEFVDGEPITDFCDRTGLGIRERLVLFRQVCDAVIHAHRRGVIHRDIKPSNILVGMGTGSTPKAKVIDFGIAKALAQRLTDRTAITVEHRPIGTYEYMSPEQADPGGRDIDIRTDVYSLGVVLYELLSGVRPFDLEKRADAEKLRIIREDDAPTPSLRLSTASARDSGTAERISKARREEIQQLVRALRSELEWIPLMAIRKDRERRYRSVEELSEDVGRYLDRKPLVAAPESMPYRVRKYVGRNKALVAGGGAVFAALIIGLGLAAWQWREADAARDAAVASEAKVRSSRDETLKQLERSNSLLGVIAAASALDGMRRNDIASVRRELSVLDELGHGDRFETRLVRAWSDRSVCEPMLGHSGRVSSVAFSPDGTVLASGSDEGAIRLWDATTARALGEPLLGHRGSVRKIAFSPDGRTIASGSWDGTVRLWDAATGRPLGEPLVGHSDRVTSVVFSRDGTTVASGSRDSSVRLWDAATGLPLGDPLVGFGDGAMPIAFGSEGRTLLLWSQEGRIISLDLAARTAVDVPLQQIWETEGCVAVSPDATVLAIGFFDGAIRLYDVATGRPLGSPLLGHGDRVTAIAFGPDGRALASGSADESIRVWDAATGQLLVEPLFGHRGDITSIAYAPDGRSIASGGTDATVRLWDREMRPFLGEPVCRHEDGIRHVALSDDGATIASCGFYSGFIRWDFLTGRPLGEPLRWRLGDPVWTIALSRDGGTLASTSDDHPIRLWDTATGQPRGKPLRGHDGGVSGVAFSRDGGVLMSFGLNDGLIRRWDATSGRLMGESARQDASPVSAAAFSPDGTTLATGSRDGMVCLRDAATGQPRGEPLRGHDDGILHVAFSPDGKTLASASMDRSIRLWDALTGRPIGDPLRGHQGSVPCVAFSADGKTLASGSGDKSVCLWDVATGRRIGQLVLADQGAVLSVDFGADGRTLAVGDSDGAIRLWSSTPVRERYRPFRDRLDTVARVRSQLADRIASVGSSGADVHAFAEAVRGDPRFRGDLRTAALIVIGEVDASRFEARTRAEAARRERLQPLENARRGRQWEAVLGLVAAARPEDLSSFDAFDWNEIAWNGLTAVPAGSSVRDLRRLLAYAERAVDLSKRGEGFILDTLARVHWELGDKAKAIEAQREAVGVSASALAKAPSEPARARHSGLEATLARYETLPAGSALPREPEPPAPKPAP